MIPLFILFYFILFYFILFYVFFSFSFPSLVFLQQLLKAFLPPNPLTWIFTLKPFLWKFLVLSSSLSFLGLSP